LKGASIPGLAEKSLIGIVFKREIPAQTSFAYLKKSATRYGSHNARLFIG
jgi:hypothetical protein